MSFINKNLNNLLMDISKKNIKILVVVGFTILFLIMLMSVFNKKEVSPKNKLNQPKQTPKENNGTTKEVSPKNEENQPKKTPKENNGTTKENPKNIKKS